MQYTVPATAADRPIVVVGAGTLGRRIAAVFAAGGSDVRIADLQQPQRDDALAYVAETTPQLRERLGDAAPAAAGRVTATADVVDALPGAWLIVEAVPERLDIKRPLFGTLDREADEDALLATNSSSYASRLVIDEVDHPERVFNMHFAMPPASMAVELMSDGSTSEGLLDAVAAELRRFGLLPFIAHAESTGFIFNRIWAAIKRESLEVVASGVSTPEDVDAIMRANMGIAAGPFALMDQVGLDIVLDIEEHYAAENPALPAGPRELLHRYVDAGKLGRKTGEGFYRYES
ncbi:3-hydroxyacyl-CoA dehydrogenase family protein [Mycetocola reblochoni]|uniref:3-hydroxybutyryl-CoA dehydrogenase 3-hydroxyacyl-CoA dehydrogenase n=2 Tax=Mycetocola reblochoni TaxID=331618 RepID=A0A1R4IS84_9MICO|nr:3-hydroxyacyl-CoA dehydrogenase family protein [Mycetocola reblochoni]RLP71126.1 3-hydroxyacyl-CoA dehydrogenase family protein [Mycetocola reblochoni]SJN22435.1 3-hydroxybutyryl-CoA dehydrogenase; 3-hydroxyacyl-CoA dehydrogenase [Mycetocola reblochoni REB411]